MPNHENHTGLKSAVADLRRQLAAAGSDNERERAIKAAAPGILAELPAGEFERRTWREGKTEGEMLGDLPDDPDEAVRAILEATEEKGGPREIRCAWTHKPPPRPWLVENWIPAHRVTLLTGEGGGGKSRLALQLAEAVAGGDPDWLPGGPKMTLPDAEYAPAVLATWEDEPDDVARLLHGYPISATPARLADRLTLLDLAGRGPLWGPAADTSGHIATRGAWTGTALWVRRFVQKIGARLLIIDPRAAAFGSDENSRALVRAFVAALDSWARDARCTVILIAHPPKGGSNYAGSTDWQAAPRAMLTLGLEETGTGEEKTENGKTRKEPAPAPRLTAAKQSYAPAGDGLWLSGYPRWEVVEDRAKQIAAEDWASARGRMSGGNRAGIGPDDF